MVEKAGINSEHTVKITKMIIEFLKLFICETLAKRVVSIVLILAGVPNKQVTILGSSEKIVEK